MRNVIRALVLVVTLGGCAGFERGCSRDMAQSFGADWIIVQYKMDGTPFNCWRLHDQSVANEKSSDGIYWTSDKGHLVHISGWYNRVQVDNNNFDDAASELGIELSKCTVGAYDGT